MRDAAKTGLTSRGLTTRGLPVVPRLLAGAGVAAASVLAFDGLTAAIACLLGWMMMAIAASDADRFIIPDLLSLPAIPAGLIANAVLAAKGAGLAVIGDHLAAALAAGGLLYLIAAAYRFCRGRSGIGMGDVKLMAAAGAWTGWHGASHVLLAACATALVFVALLHVSAERQLTATTAIPFGAFLAPAIWIVWALQQI